MPEKIRCGDPDILELWVEATLDEWWVGHIALTQYEVYNSNILVTLETGVSSQVYLAADGVRTSSRHSTYEDIHG